MMIARTVIHTRKSHYIKVNHNNSKIIFSIEKNIFSDIISEATILEIIKLKETFSALPWKKSHSNSVWVVVLVVIDYINTLKNDVKIQEPLGT